MPGTAESSCSVVQPEKWLAYLSISTKFRAGDLTGKHLAKNSHSLACSLPGQVPSGSVPRLSCLVELLIEYEPLGYTFEIYTQDLKIQSFSTVT